MKGLVRFAACSAAMLLACGGVGAADLDTLVTKAPVAPPSSQACTSIQDFFLTACQLSWYGVRFYGTVDVGFGYQTHGAQLFARQSELTRQLFT